MRLRILTTALLAGILLIQPPIGTAQKRKRSKHAPAQIDRWYVFVSPDGDFTLSFPERPNREADEPGPVTAFKSYGLYTQNAMRFSVNFTEVPGDPNSRLANEWNDGFEQELLSKDREEKRRVVHTQRIGKNIFEAEIWDSGTDTGDGINYLRQTIVRHGRIYTLLCGSEIYGRPMNKSICRRFLNSMHFINQNAPASR